MSDGIELVWHNDGHFIELYINKEDIRVTPLACPNGEKSNAPCYHEGVSGCIVKHFIKTYGLETNIGMCDASPRIEIAWASDGSKWDIDLVHFYMTPIDDPAFKDWLSAQLSASE